MCDAGAATICDTPKNLGLNIFINNNTKRFVFK